MHTVLVHHFTTHPSSRSSSAGYSGRTLCPPHIAAAGPDLDRVELEIGLDLSVQRLIVSIQDDGRAALGAMSEAVPALAALHCEVRDATQEGIYDGHRALDVANPPIKHRSRVLVSPGRTGLSSFPGGSTYSTVISSDI